MKKDKVQQILVYTDFTPVSNNSLAWGVYFAKKFEKEILLIHVINDNSYHIFDKDSIEFDVENRLKSIAKKIKEEHNIKCSTYFEEGCTCTVINSSAESHDTFFNIIGIHGKNDMQFLSGHSASKIIRKSRIPYFTVQKNSKLPVEFNFAVLPIDTRKEMKEQTGWVTYLAKNLNIGIDIFIPNINDERLRNNFSFCTKFFSKFDLEFNKVISPKKYFGFRKSVINYAENNNSPFIVTLSTKELSLIDWVFGPTEARTISNKKGVPVFIINPKKDLYVPCI